MTDIDKETKYTSKVSVIIPCYNVERYIGRCIESLQAQTLKELEFIFVDDCSTDESMTTVEAWAAEDERVRILRNEENFGAGQSRNRGIESARGEYLSFVDPDDYVSPDFYELLYTAALADGGHDIAKGRAARVSKDNEISYEASDRLDLSIERQIAKGKPLRNLFVGDHWSAIYRHRLFENDDVRYGSSRHAQDVTFLLCVCSQTQDIVFAKEASYYYVARDGSVDSVPNIELFESKIDALDESLVFLMKQGVLTDDDYRYLGLKLAYRYQAYRDAMESNAELAYHHPAFASRIARFIKKVPDPKRIAKQKRLLADLLEHLPLITQGLRAPGEGEVRISVILPVYNPGPGINKCIESLRMQLLDGIEFIFVDDCSTDRSMEEVEAWASEDARVRILRNKDNMGAGRSRNRGIEAARGDYLSFVDPDDYISPDFYELLYSFVTADGGHDIAKGSCIQVGDSNDNALPQSGLNERIAACLNDKQPLYTIFTYEHWSAIYRKTLFADKTIRYSSSLYGEDVTFLLRCCYQTNDIVMDDRANYYYVARSDSATLANPSSKAFYQLDGFEEQLAFLAQKGVSVPEDSYTCRRCNGCLTASYLIHKEHPDFNSELSTYLQRFCGIIRSFNGDGALLDKSVATRAVLEYGRLLPAPSLIPQKHLLEGLQDWVEFLAVIPSESVSFYRELALGTRIQISRLWRLKPAMEALKATHKVNSLCKNLPLADRAAIRMTGLSCRLRNAFHTIKRRFTHGA